MMISQADIIKTLVNKNCTDESVMMVALSPDCTPPKLLEKLTEAERFDLALDVSMKLGLDVMPLWRTWAMRSLQNYNFQVARDKFRHCFVRFRQPGGRTSPMHNKLLTDILRQLSKMSDTKLPLLEEIELIKRRQLHEHDDQGREQPILSRMKIYDECCWYLKEYGNPNDWIRFYARNSLWDKAVEALLAKSHSKTEDDKFFLTDVVLYSTSRGHLCDLIEAFKNLDPMVVRSTRYFKIIYTFCLRNRRYNLLYYVQSSIHDHIAAANTLIEQMFLKKPVASYRELNHRVGNLTQACTEYRHYVEINKTKSPQGGESYLGNLPLDEVEKRIGLVETQIEITRNFAVNEVSGCISSVNLDDNNELIGSPDIRSTSDDHGIDQNSPVTLFDTDEKRKTFLAALVLMYYDVSCSTYFSDSGLELTNKLIIDNGLDKVKVFKTAMRIIIEDESCDIIENATLLLERIKEDYATDYRKQRCAITPINAKPLTSIDRHTNSPILKREKPQSQQQQQQPRQQRHKLSLVTKASIGANKAATILKRSQTSDKPLSTGASMLKDGINGTSGGTGGSSGADSLVMSNATGAKFDQEIVEGARAMCDEVIRDSIGSCSEPDYKMELAKLLSGEAKIELYIEHGKLSNAQRLACTMDRPDYVSHIIDAATRLNQNHVKTVCQLWLAKHETRNSIR